MTLPASRSAKECCSHGRGELDFSVDWLGRLVERCRACELEAKIRAMPHELRKRYRRARENERRRSRRRQRYPLRCVECGEPTAGKAVRCELHRLEAKREKWRRGRATNRERRNAQDRARRCRWTPERRAYQKHLNKRWREENPERAREAARASMKRFRERNPDYFWEWHRKRREAQFVDAEPAARGDRRNAARDTTGDTETAWREHERRVSGEQNCVDQATR